MSPHKSSIIGWSLSPPDWVGSKGWQWLGPNEIVRYLGIPFFIEPSTKDIWMWLFSVVEKKYLKWKNHLLSLAVRVQVV